MARMDRKDRLSRRAARGDANAEFEAFVDRVAAGEVWIDWHGIPGTHGEAPVAEKVRRDLERFAGRPALLSGEVRGQFGWSNLRESTQDVALVVVDPLANHREADLACVDYQSGDTAPEWRCTLVRPHRLLGDPNVIFFPGPMYHASGRLVPGRRSCGLREIVGARIGEGRLVARWLETLGWPDDPAWVGTTLDGWSQRRRNPILGPVERRESAEPPSCPACAVSWERFSRRRGGWFFMCKRCATAAERRRGADARSRRVREIERLGDPGWTFDPDECREE